MSKYRYEHKYIINSFQEQILLLRAESILNRDPHTKLNGSYSVRSLYFDNYYDDCLYDTGDGVDLRSKYRMRYYNSPEYISLEKKSKIHGKTLKQSCQLNYTEAELLMNGIIPQPAEDSSDEKKTMFLEMQLRSLIPKVIVSYERIPFVYPAGNVRITFDKDISSSNDIAGFLQTNYSSRPVMPQGFCVLEIKWDELLPAAIYDLLAINNMQWTSFSKYYMCRLYHL